MIKEANSDLHSLAGFAGRGLRSLVVSLKADYSAGKLQRSLDEQEKREKERREREEEER